MTTKIEWCDYTWNPVTGCHHNCSYCYARRIATRFAGGKAFPNGFEPTCWLSKRINEPMLVVRKSKIFVCSMGDLFGDWLWKVPRNGRYVLGVGIIEMILRVAEKCPQHTFMFLTKNPKGMQGFKFPKNCWCGVTVENQEKANERIPQLLQVQVNTKFISIEPILGPVDLEFWSQFEHPDNEGYGVDAIKGLDWVIVGAQTGPGAKLPPATWVEDIIDQCRLPGVPVFLKDNLHWPEKIQEFPKLKQ